MVHAMSNLRCQAAGLGLGRPKILMLHGHGQCAETLFYKTSFLRGPSERSWPWVPTALDQPEDLSAYAELVYVDGPFAPDDDSDGHARMWGQGDFEHEQVKGLDHSVQLIARVLEEKGPFVGIMGFSTGAALAVVLASLLESDQRRQTMKFTVDHPPFRFVIAFSGFMLGHEAYQFLYAPEIHTPMLLFRGQLDTMIAPALTGQLAECCSHATVEPFYGTHYVPRSARAFQQIMKFIEDSMNGPISLVYEDGCCLLWRTGNVARRSALCITAA